MKSKILVIDDELSVRESFKFILEHKYDVEGATCGKEALELVDKKQYDLIILDYCLPDIDGFKVLTAIENKKHKQEIIFVSGMLDTAKTPKGYTVFKKPIDPYAVLSCIDSILSFRPTMLKVIDKTIKGTSKN